MVRKTRYGRFSHWVERQPDAVAIVEDGSSVSYRELDVMANAIMSKFYSKGYAAVGVVMTHGIEMIAAMLAVLKSGTAYVPAEPSLPRNRIDSNGVGHSIVRWLVEKARELGCDKIYLETSDGARSLYKSVGFKELPGIMKYADVQNSES